MAKQVINIGTVANDGTGDPIRTGGGKINDNFTELYALSDHPTTFEFVGSTRRLQLRGGVLCIDRTLTVTGFGGSENTDWECIADF